MILSCIARFVQSLLCSTRKSTSESTIFTIIALLLPFIDRKNVTPGIFCWAIRQPFGRNIQNLTKVLGIWGKSGSRHEKDCHAFRDFNSRAFYAQVRLVFNEERLHLRAPEFMVISAPRRCRKTQSAWPRLARASMRGYGQWHSQRGLGGRRCRDPQRAPAPRPPPEEV